MPAQWTGELVGKMHNNQSVVTRTCSKNRMLHKVVEHGP